MLLVRRFQIDVQGANGVLVAEQLGCVYDNHALSVGGVESALKLAFLKDRSCWVGGNNHVHAFATHLSTGTCIARKCGDLRAQAMAGDDDLDEPTFQRIQRRQAVNESPGSLYSGYKGMVIDNNDLDVPTFLRRKAD